MGFFQFFSYICIFCGLCAQPYNETEFATALAEAREHMRPVTEYYAKLDAETAEINKRQAEEDAERRARWKADPNAVGFGPGVTGPVGVVDAISRLVKRHTARYYDSTAQADLYFTIGYDGSVVKGPNKKE